VGQTVTLSESQAAVAGHASALLVVGVAAEGPADRAGVLVGDIVLAVNDAITTSSQELLEALSAMPAGRQTTLRLLRGGGPVDLVITLGERPAQ
jgi:S1-C subfamily serine protease